MLSTIYDIAEKHRYAFHESTWKKIDDEKDYFTLTFYASLIGVDEPQIAKLYHVILDSNEFSSFLLDHIRKI